MQYIGQYGHKYHETEKANKQMYNLIIARKVLNMLQYRA
jgi:hypothetical protein